MDNGAFARLMKRAQHPERSSLRLEVGSRVAVVGGGPAGSFFSYFLLDMGRRAGLNLTVDIYEPRDFDAPGPAGCNMCGGVLYEALVQALAVEGINLPTSVVQRGIECNVLHLDAGSVEIRTPRHEKRIATTFRGGGPRGALGSPGESLDGYLLRAAVSKGARHVAERVSAVTRVAGEAADGRVRIETQRGLAETYELVAVTAGVNTAILEHMRGMDRAYLPPRTAKLMVREYRLGQEAVSRYLGPAFHAFLLNIPGLDYGAIIPKGEYVTVCLLSSHGSLTAEAMDAFLQDPAVKGLMPPDFSPAAHACHCGPRINVSGSARPFADRIVFIGDSGVSRLYKDGIGAAYRAAKIAAGTAIFQGISSDDFARHYLPFCRKMQADNRVGQLLFRAVGLMRRSGLARRTLLRMVTREQQAGSGAESGMSAVMWDMLTGGAPFADVLQRVLHPRFLVRWLANMAASLGNAGGAERPPLDPDGGAGAAAERGALGRLYQGGEAIVRQGELGDCMYVVQEGQVEVVLEHEGQEVRLNVLGQGDFFGEMAIFEGEIRSASVQALGPARVLTIDQESLLRRIQEDPSLAFRLLQGLSARVRRLSAEVGQLQPRP